MANPFERVSTEAYTAIEQALTAVPGGLRAFSRGVDLLTRGKLTPLEFVVTGTPTAFCTHRLVPGAATLVSAQWTEAATISGRCDCGGGAVCEHVAATALAWGNSMLAARPTRTERGDAPEKAVAGKRGLKRANTPSKEPASPPPPPSPPAPTDGPSVDLWVFENGLTGIQALTLRELAVLAGTQLSPGLAYLAYEPASQVLSGRSGYTAKVLAPAVAALVVEAGRGAMARRDAAMEAIQALPPPESSTLAPWYERTLALWRTLHREYGLRPAPELRLLPAPSATAFRVAFDPTPRCNGRTATVYFHDASSTVSVLCDCGRGRSCEAGYHAVTLAVRLLADAPAPITGPEVDKLIAALALEPWERAVASLDDALHQAPDDLPALGWRFESDSGVLHALALREKQLKRGTRLSVRLATSAELHKIDAGGSLPPQQRVALDLYFQAFEARQHNFMRTRLSPEESGRVLLQLGGAANVFVDAAQTPSPVVRADARLDLASESDQLAGLRVMLGRVALEPSHFLRQASPTMHFGPTSTVAAAFADDVLYVGRVDRRLVRMVEGGTARVTGVPREAIPEIGASLARAVDLPLAIDPALSDRIVPGACEPILVASRPSAVATPGDLQGIVFSWVVCPAPGAAVRTPGEPPEQFFWTVDGELALVDRSLRSELDACAAAALRTNAPLQDDGPEMFWSCSDADEVLAQLGRARDAGVEVRWIGSPVTSRAASFDSLKLQLSSGRDWFGASGGLEVDGAVVPLAELLAAIRERRRSVKLDDNTWATLPDEFANALRALARVTTGKAKEKLSPLHAALFDSLEQSGVEVEAPTRWRELTTRVREAATLTVRAPRGLKAQLRPYQREGYEWLVRTAHWSTGACLADDMGLGKTVQAIALLLQRARGGRALVVCPTSVAFNWERECARFAPSLRVATYTGRDAELPKLGASDIMIVSYDLLALYPTRFEGVWNTVVIDEAQALKNHTTRRARAVHGLEADFVVALTGTPVENRSTEAWSLFRSIAPGYLGSYEDFRERFAIPIERDGDTHARTALGALMRPLILRRLKRDVARDLPDRIESRLDVTLGDFERDTYDRLRKSSIDLLQNRPPGMSPLEARILALAALTRLRQTACHARLVDPDAPEVSAKQLAVTELLGELKEEGRRALVFSQFTSLLDLVEPGLTAAGLRWLRLDGSTPAAKRRQLVDEFQAGDVDVFLLSLKAGGAGLNLTAADTVIHLDPWWNPAVEDQATDRAHRIGQTQKVTVVRVVALETVEEAILELHSTKRELVDALLDGTGEASVVSLDELMRLVGAS